jgi:hypothetical protein
MHQNFQPADLLRFGQPIQTELFLALPNLDFAKTGSRSVEVR